MSRKHPQNGPSLSKASQTKRASRPVPSPGRREAEQNQNARDAEKTRQFNKRLRNDMDGFVKELSKRLKGD